MIFYQSQGYISCLQSPPMNLEESVGTEQDTCLRPSCFDHVEGGVEEAVATTRPPTRGFYLSSSLREGSIVRIQQRLTRSIHQLHQVPRVAKRSSDVSVLRTDRVEPESTRHDYHN